MEQYYTVRFGNKDVGKVEVLRQGLYYRFLCRCRLDTSAMLRLHVMCNDREENLGLVVPMDDGFGLDTRIPVKKIGEGDMLFMLRPKHTEASNFAPITPQEPFSYISSLKEGFLAIQNGQIGLQFKQKLG